MTTGKFDSGIVDRIETKLWESIDYFDDRGGEANNILWKSRKIL